MQMQRDPLRKTKARQQPGVLLLLCHHHHHPSKPLSRNPLLAFLFGRSHHLPRHFRFPEARCVSGLYQDRRATRKYRRRRRAVPQLTAAVLRRGQHPLRRARRTGVLQPWLPANGRRHPPHPRRHLPLVLQPCHILLPCLRGGPQRQLREQRQHPAVTHEIRRGKLQPSAFGARVRRVRVR
jgi:hypothetical protein